MSILLDTSILVKEITKELEKIIDKKITFYPLNRYYEKIYFRYFRKKWNLDEFSVL